MQSGSHWSLVFYSGQIIYYVQAAMLYPFFCFVSFILHRNAELLKAGKLASYNENMQILRNLI